MLTIPDVVKARSTVPSTAAQSAISAIDAGPINSSRSGRERGQPRARRSSHPGRMAARNTWTAAIRWRHRHAPPFAGVASPVLAYGASARLWVPLCCRGSPVDDGRVSST